MRSGNFSFLPRDALRVIIAGALAIAAAAASSINHDPAMLSQVVKQNTDLSTILSYLAADVVNNTSSSSNMINSTTSSLISTLMSNSSLEVHGSDSDLMPAIAISSIGSEPSSSILEVDPPPDIRFPMYLRCSATTICLILLFCGCPGNLLVPYVVLKTKDLRNSTNIFLINLSVSDLLILLVMSPTILIELHSQPEVWFLGLFMCEFLFQHTLMLIAI